MNTLSILQEEHIASVREVQKNPSKALRGVTRVMRGSKTLGFFLDQKAMRQFFEDIQENFEAANSKGLRKRLKKAEEDIKKGRVIPFREMKF